MSSIELCVLYAVHYSTATVLLPSLLLSVSFNRLIGGGSIAPQLRVR